MWKNTINLNDYFVMNIIIFHEQEQRHKTDNRGGPDKNIIKKIRIKPSNEQVLFFDLWRLKIYLNINKMTNYMFLACFPRKSVRVGWLVFLKTRIPF